MNVEKILNEMDDMYINLMEAYEIAGSLRDTFSGVGMNEGKLKEYCNKIRENLYEIRMLKTDFKSDINSLNQLN